MFMDKTELQQVVQTLRKHVPPGAVTARRALRMMASACGDLDSGGHPTALWKLQASLIEHRIETFLDYGNDGEDFHCALVVIHGAMRAWIAQLTQEELDQVGVEDHLATMRAYMAKLREKKEVVSSIQ